MKIGRWCRPRWCTRDGWCGADGGRSADPTSICAISCWSPVCLLTTRESLSIMWYCLNFIFFFFEVEAKWKAAYSVWEKGGMELEFKIVVGTAENPFYLFKHLFEIICADAGLGFDCLCLCLLIRFQSRRFWLMGIVGWRTEGWRLTMDMWDAVISFLRVVSTFCSICSVDEKFKSNSTSWCILPIDFLILLPFFFWEKQTEQYIILCNHWDNGKF